MKEEFSREAMLIGEDAVKKLNNSSVALFGLGGVGSYTAEALARSGIGKIMIVDNDKVSVSNINRQLCALQSTVGKYKTEVDKQRLLDINPDIEIIERKDFVLPENIDEFDLSSFDYVIDAVDTVAAKIALVEKAGTAGVPIISAMGAGNKLDPTAFTVSDIYKTTVCPLARVMRRELKARGIRKLKVVYSTEEARKIDLSGEEPSNGRHPPASTSFVPGVVGLILAGEVIKDLTATEPENN